MNRQRKAQQAEMIQVQSMSEAARNLANARYAYCINQALWMNRGSNADTFCKAYAYASESLLSGVQRGAKNVSRSAASTVNAKGSAQASSQQPFAHNPALVQQAYKGRVQHQL